MPEQPRGRIDRAFEIAFYVGGALAASVAIVEALRFMHGG